MAVSEEFDLIVRNGFVVDGTGLPRRRVDVGVRDGKVVAPRASRPGAPLGRRSMPRARSWHPASSTCTRTTTRRSRSIRTRRSRASTASPPCSPATAVSRSRRAEPRTATSCRASSPESRTWTRSRCRAITWDQFETFDEFLASRRGRLGVNFACYVGHSNLRRWVMGEDASARAATEPEIAEMRATAAPRRWRRARPGLSSSAAPTHLDIDDRPVPSRLADSRRVAGARRRAGSRRSQASSRSCPQSSIGGLDDADEELPDRALAAKRDCR